ncbi:methyl farnesoate epoxidase-like [Toxorhynchites rutilus septentrionalis]|uniref:methyl farnesoate epoxidase-like n=1 Tax=Toxorhynchites rutilus septentrionalis TaxID=329112 RepID=UPI00247A289F|nr:methyl farnesoate epoxidase-like [Toxorhynchites rutilus septentrionalis]
MWQNLIAVIIFVVIYCLRDARKPQFYPPGPNWLPLVGCGVYVFNLMKRFNFYHLMWHDLARRFGSVVGLKLGRDRVVIISGLEAVREFYSKDEFNGRPNGFFFRVRSFNKRLGVVFTDGEEWEVQRRFSVRTLKLLGMGKTGMVSNLEKESDDLIQHFRKFSRTQKTINMHNAFDIAVLNVIWTLIAGKRFHLGDKRLEWITGTIHKSFRVIDMSGGVLNQLPCVRYICPVKSGFAPLVRLLKPLWDFLENTIKVIASRSNAAEDYDCLISSYLRELQKDELHPSFSYEQLLCVCLDLFQAGSETTSNTLGFGVAYMLHHPEVVSKMHQELDNVVGRYRLPLLRDRPYLPYTEAVICEIQRMSNVAPLAIAHRTVSPVQLGTYLIPENTITMVSLYSLHMDKAYWGDPETFRPERFLNETGTQVIQHECFLPFGAGKRRCLGESLAKSNLFLFFASFMHAFIVEPAVDGQLPQLEGIDGITLSPKPYRVFLKERLIYWTHKH